MTKSAALKPFGTAAARSIRRVSECLQMIKRNAADGGVIVGQKPSRRAFCAAAIGAFVSVLARPALFFSFKTDQNVPKIDLAAIDRKRVLRAAERYLREAPITITAFPA